MLEHGPHGHSGTRRLGLAAVLTAGFMVAEAAGGYLTGSLALLADAGHMLTDAAALTMAFAAARLAARPADSHRSYGYHRIQVLAALVNALALLLLVGWLVAEALQRLVTPRHIDAPWMLAIALLGGALNVGVAFLLREHEQSDLNLSAAYAHVLSDLGGSAAAALAAIVILTTGWTRADPLLSLLVAALIARLAIGLLRRSAHILMEGTPEGIEPDRLADEIGRAFAGIQDVHHLHAWSLGSQQVLVTLHVRLDPSQDTDLALLAIKQLLAERYGITHSTIQMERGSCADHR